MKTVIVGCGRVGSVLADAFDRAGHQVVVVDTSTAAFDRLPPSFKGAAIRGDGTDEDTLRRAGAEDADVFMAMTEGDNRNVMSAQLATEALGARKVIAKINDPLRASAYAELGIATLCRTNLMAHAVSAFVGLGAAFGPGLSEATGQHPGGEHHHDDPAAPTGGPGATDPGHTHLARPEPQATSAAVASAAPGGAPASSAQSASMADGAASAASPAPAPSAPSAGAGTASPALGVASVASIDSTLAPSAPSTAREG